MAALIEWTSLLQPLVVGVAAVVGSTVAVLGLHTWRKQLKGRAEYELARRYLRATLHLRDQINNLRRPLILAAEMAVAAEEAGVDITKLPNDSPEPALAARNRRWRAVQEAISALRVEELEAEVLWGDSVAKCTDDLHRRIHEVWLAEQEYHDRTRGGGVPSHDDRERIPQLRRVMYGAGSDRDEMAKTIAASVQAVENVIRPKLKP